MPARLELSKDWTVVSRVDTRDYERTDSGAFRAVPGSGDPEPCACCGRNVVIHAIVRNKKTGDVALVGETCAMQKSLLGAVLGPHASKAEKNRRMSIRLIEEYYGRPAEELVGDGRTHVGKQLVKLGVPVR